MPDTYTPKYNLTKPEVGSSRDAWGTKWNGNADAIDAALDALKSDYTAKIAALKASIEVGAIVDFGMTTPPDGWLKCNGASVAIADYPLLYAAIGGTWGMPDGQHFLLPDVRGLFRRGLDDGRGIDPGRGMGSFQEHAIPPHFHVGRGGGQWFLSVYAGLGDAAVLTGAGGTYGYDNWTYNATGAPVASETRPRSIAFPAYIRYK